MTSTFALWHRDTPTFMDNTPDILTAFPTGFTLVAYVETDDVGRVFQLSNHIDSDWTKNPEVTVYPSMVAAGGRRSTSVGDVVIADTPDARYTIDGIGLPEILMQDLDNAISLLTTSANALDESADFIGALESLGEEAETLAFDLRSALTLVETVTRRIQKIESDAQMAWEKERGF